MSVNSKIEELFVIKRNGKKTPLDFNKIVKRLSAHAQDLSGVNVKEVALSIANNIVDGIETRVIDTLIAKECHKRADRNHNYTLLAGRILVSSHQKDTPKSFLESQTKVYEENMYKNSKTKKMESRLLRPEYIEFVQKHAEELEAMINYDRDFNFDYFGFLTFKSKFLLGKPLAQGEVKEKRIAIERPQHAFLRVAIEIHRDDLENVKKAYDKMSTTRISFASPTNMNAGSIKNQLSSCFLLDVDDDSIDGIFESEKEMAKISQAAGGIGIALTRIRAKGSIIASTGYHCDGILPVLQIYGHTLAYVNQGGRRDGAGAFYIEPWHLDLFDVIESRNNVDETKNAKRVNPAVWMNSLLIERALNDENWTQFSPSDTPDLINLYGEDFKKRYEEYEQDSEITHKKVTKATDILMRISKDVIEQGVYVCYKDNANLKSNQSNIGTIKSSNLCAEIMEVASKDQTAVCNLGSMILWAYLEDGKFNFEKFGEDVEFMVLSLNRVLDNNHYVNNKCRSSNMANRPIGLGVQGLADVFMRLRIPYDSQEAKELNKQIFEAMYYHSLKASLEYAKKHGAYETFKGSPLSEGKFQFDLWREDYLRRGQVELANGITHSISMEKWDALREEIKVHGVANSLLTALMPTATTSQTYGSVESFEPLTENMYIRKTDVGEISLTNKYLQEMLVERGLWNTDLVNEIISNKGSIEGLTSIPKDIADICKTVYSIKVSDLLKMSADRGAFICQSQSLNLYMNEPSISKVATVIKMANDLGLKTGIYYLKNPVKVSRNPVLLEAKTEAEKHEEKKAICSLENRESCDMCGA